MHLSPAPSPCPQPAAIDPPPVGMGLSSLGSGPPPTATLPPLAVSLAMTPLPAIAMGPSPSAGYPSLNVAHPPAAATHPSEHSSQLSSAILSPDMPLPLRSHVQMEHEPELVNDEGSHDMEILPPLINLENFSTPKKSATSAHFVVRRVHPTVMTT